MVRQRNRLLQQGARPHRNYGEDQRLISNELHNAKNAAPASAQRFFASIYPERYQKRTGNRTPSRQKQASFFCRWY